jgi:phage minor structural protein
MQFIVFDSADNRLFVRNDAEIAEWSVDQMSFSASFPYVKEKELQRGMRIGFTDADGVFQPFEIRKAKLYEPDHYQEITAEHIAVAELTDEFYQGEDVTDETPAQVLSALLTGTAWSVGNCTATNVSSLNIDKGNVWKNIRAMEKNWNVIVSPRVTFSATGITGRYIDVAPNIGTWRGVVLSVDSTMDEIGVVWDDSELVTAVYGLGGNVETQGGTSQALTFAEAVWEATEDHPAKPEGQTYIEDPTAKALYGRNGRNRFGYYQNSNIKDAETLLEKSWEYLQTVNAPTVTIDCIVRDLKRMGYAGQDVRLHDKVQVQIRPTGKVLVLDVTKLDIDLLNPTATRPTIGKYIPNIVYINRETAMQAGGGYRTGGQNDKEYKMQEFYTLSERNEFNIRLEATQRAYVDGQLSSSIAANTAALNIDATNITGIVAGAGAQLDEDGRLVVDSSGFPVFTQSNPNSMYSRINQNASDITLRVVKGDVATQLAVECGNVTITGGNLTVDGVITASDLAAGNIYIGNVQIGTYLEVGYPNVAMTVDSSGNITGESLGVSGAITGSSVTIEGATTDAEITNAKALGLVYGLTLTPPASGSSTYTLSWTTVDGQSHSATFNRAASTITLSGAWSGATTFTVTPSPQSAGSPYVETMTYSVSPTPSGGSSSTTIDNFNSNHKAAVTVQGSSNPGAYLRQYLIDADSVFQDGYDNCKAIVDITSTTVGSVSASGGTVSIDVDVGIGDASSTWRTSTATATTTITQGTPSWGSTTTGNSNTFTVTDSAGASVSQSVYLSQDAGWSGGSKSVYLTHTNSSLTNQVAETAVSVPSITNPSAWSGHGSQQSADETFTLGIGYDWYTLLVDCGGRTKRLQVHILRS